MKIKSVLTIFIIVSLILPPAAAAKSEIFKTARAKTNVLNEAGKMLDDIEIQAGKGNFNEKNRKEFINMLEFEIEKEDNFINELKRHLKCLEQYSAMLALTKEKTSSLYTKISGKVDKSSYKPFNFAETEKKLKSGHILDSETLNNFDETIKTLNGIEKDISANKINGKKLATLTDYLKQQLSAIDLMIDQADISVKNVENNIVKALEIKNKSKNLLKKFMEYKPAIIKR